MRFLFLCFAFLAVAISSPLLFPRQWTKDIPIKMAKYPFNEVGPAIPHIKKKKKFGPGQFDPHCPNDRPYSICCPHDFDQPGERNFYGSCYGCRSTQLAQQALAFSKGEFLLICYPVW